jgi:WXXGXW repeat (2 copies)
MPGPGFVWIDGYWYAAGSRYRWHQGYWSRPPYEGAHWVGPRHDGERFYAGYWEGGHGRIEHDHRWDRDHDRDYRH